MAFEAAIAAALAFLAVYRLATPIPAGQEAVTVKLVLASSTYGAIAPFWISSTDQLLHPAGPLGAKR